MDLHYGTEEELKQMIKDVQDIPNKICNKIKENYNADYDLILVDINTGYGTLIKQPKEEIYPIINYVWSTEKVTEFTDFKIKNNSYRIYINITRGRISGQYKVENKQLVLISKEKIDLVVYDGIQPKHKHHYVPKVYFRHFNNDKQFICFKIDENKQFKANYEKVCHEHNLHEISKYLSINYIEDKLSKIENSYTDMFNRLDNHISNRIIDENDKVDLFNYITLQFFRHPSQIRNIENRFNTKKQIFEEYGRFIALTNLINGYGTPVELANSLLQTHSLEIYSSDTLLMTSDMPVTLMDGGVLNFVEPPDFEYGYLAVCDYWFVYDEHTLIILKYSPIGKTIHYGNLDQILRMRYMISAAENGANYFFAETISDNEIEILKRFNHNYCEHKIDFIECYIEEYTNQKGLCARLRDKRTNKKVAFWGDSFNWRHLLRFLSQAKINLNIMPTVYDRYGNDIVAVRGIIIDESSDEITVDVNVETGGYMFE